MHLATQIKECALEAGFDLVGIATPSSHKDLEFLPDWVKKGYGGEMEYLADPRREDPRRILASVKSVICVGLAYNAPRPYSTDARGGNEPDLDSVVSPASKPDMQSRGWISRYAWGTDYHHVMRSKLERLRTALEKLAAGVETRVYVDTGPIVERAFARLSGMGWTGKNTCLINEGKGSWFFLGVILTSLELAPDLPAPDRCGSCTRCLEACPTGALVEPYVMDASRCIAYLNIELKGAVPERFREAMGNNVVGCDICQDVCPWNSPQRAAISSLPEFQPMLLPATIRGESLPLPEAAEMEVDGEASLFNPSLRVLASLTEEDFRRFFARSPIKRVKYRGWLRNLCVAMGNSKNPQFIPWLEAAAGHPDPIIREHAAWALDRLQAGG
jgi:epoxyqueuosine reductase